MRRQQAADDKLTYAYLTVLNICVVVLFAVLLTPDPIEPVVAHVMPGHDPRSSALVNQNSPEPIIGTPSRVVVSSVGIDQVIKPGAYNIHNKTWSVDSTSAFHATTTVPVNNTNGTTLIYGHAEWAIFGKLLEVTPGAEASVYTLEGHRFIYNFESSQQVTPNDVSALTSLGPPKLLLQTCSGPFDIYRTLVTFTLKAVVHDE